MAKKAKRVLVWLLLFGVIAGGGGVVAFLGMDSSYKAEYYLQKAFALDEAKADGAFEAIRHYKEAIKTYKAIGDTQGAANAHIHLALLHFKFGNVLQVERQMLEALKLGENNIPDSLKAKSYLLLASTSEPDKAKNYLEKALNIAYSQDLKPQIIRGYFLLGKMYEYEANFEAAEENYLKAIGYVERHPSTVYMVDMVPLYERLGELYAGGGESDRAFAYYDKALSYSLAKPELSIAPARFFKAIGDLHSEEQHLEKACDFWRKSAEHYYLVGQKYQLSDTGYSLPIECQEFAVGSEGPDAENITVTATQ